MSIIGHCADVGGLAGLALTHDYACIKCGKPTSFFGFRCEGCRTAHMQAIAATKETDRLAALSVELAERETSIGLMNC